MSKYNYIITKIKLFYKKLFGKMSVINSKVEIKDSKTILENVLIIFPIDEPSFRVALYTFRNFEGNNTNYYYLINRVHNSHFHLVGEIYNMNYIKNKVFFDKNFEKVNDMKFDMVIDLNEHFNYELSLAISKIDANFKVGIKKEFSDLFYNLQFDFSQSNILENGYARIRSMLR